MNYIEHWNSVYDSKTDEQLGWYEAMPEKTMQLIEDCNLQPHATILTVGAGTTTLIDELLKKGFTNLIANDLSESALKNLKRRIKSDFNYNLECIVDDLTQPSSLQKLSDIDLWIDRAVLHFFLKEEEQKAYFGLIKKIVAKNGFVLIAVFAIDGAEKCSGLPLQRYDVTMLKQKLGDNFKLIDSFNYTFINPFGGERPYVYTLFQRQ
tara:strand:- start:12610 stop:13233 length:624 start_codon:yes stop_codon:yes gene_type:complete